MVEPILSVEEIRALLVRKGLDPEGVDLEWIARINHDTERRIAEHKAGTEFADATATISAVPPS
jgi:hypothetical protein